MKLIRPTFMILSFGYIGYCHAAAQVVDATPIEPQYIQSQAPILSVEQRLSRLEQQLQNRQQLDLIGQINGLQQALQELRGQVDELSHKQTQLESRLNTIYQTSNRNLDKPRPTMHAATLKPTAQIHQASNSLAAPAAAKQQLANASALQEQNAYQVGYNHLKNRSYPQAITAMESYLQQFPAGKYAASAHYWLGELYLVQKQLDKAAAQFNTVVSHYPHDSKVADATLKLGMVHYSMGQYPQARTLFLQVNKQHPGTAAARLAEAKLQDMGNRP